MIRRVSNPRPGFTLIELLISMTITLIMVYALVQFMVYISTFVSEGRGQIEMANSIRGVKQRLANDLKMATVFQKPSPGTDNGDGYVETGEGPRHDADIDNNGTFDVYEAAYLIDGSGTTKPMDRDRNNKTDDTESKGPILGDVDDYLCLTAHSRGEPFVGSVGGATLTSELAEIAWFTCHWEVNARDPRWKANANPWFRCYWDSTEVTPSTWIPTFPVGPDPTAAIAVPANSAMDVGEFRQDCTLYRRVLLIRPDQNTNYDPATGVSYVVQLPDPTNAANLAKIPGTAGAADPAPYPINVYSALFAFWQSHDLSVRIEHRFVGGTHYWYLVANSLSDLSRRENRFAAAWVPSLVTDPALNYGAVKIFSATPPEAGNRFHHRDKLALVVLNYERLGQDVMLSHVTGFDIRVFDPEAINIVDAPNSASTTTNSILIPGDPAYNTAFATYATAGSLPSNIVGKGAFVDLGYGIYTPSANTAFGASYFSTYLPVARAGGLSRVFDTWSYSYEHDGLDQDGDLVDSNGNSRPDPGEPNIDEGADGLDNNNQYGVDDPTERETLPPYPDPVVLSALGRSVPPSISLTGVQIRLRAYDQSIRLGRQATVVAEFTK